MKIHKRIIKRVKEGHCPFFAACGCTNDEIQMTTKVESVTCKKCLNLGTKTQFKDFKMITQRGRGKWHMRTN